MVRHMFNRHDAKRDRLMLTGKLARQGYDRWWHSFTAVDENGFEKPFFIEFFACNPALSNDEAVIGRLPKNIGSGRRPSYLMVSVGCWGDDGALLRRFVPWKDVEAHDGVPYSIAGAGCFCDETSTHGHVSVSEEDAEAHPEWMCDAGDMKWDLRIDKRITYNAGHGTGGLFHAAKPTETSWHAEGMKTVYSGTITYNGREYRASHESCYGYADKSWGSGLSCPWIRLISCDLVSKNAGKRLSNSCLAMIGEKSGTDWNVLGGMFYEGECLEFSSSKHRSGEGTTLEFKAGGSRTSWRVSHAGREERFVADVECLGKDVMRTGYESPDGKAADVVWIGGNGSGMLRLYRGNELVDEILIGHVICEYCPEETAYPIAEAAGTESK